MSAQVPNTPEVLPAETLAKEKDYAEFEIGHHPVPWFLWVFFGLIITWASISWIPFFGY
jgi:hypothetical protein